MPRRSGLGRGLEALIPTGERPSQIGTSYIPQERIVSNPRQPRSHIDPEDLAELAASIKEHGILQPLLVTYDDLTGNYTLIAGERRLLAARQAGLDHVPAIVREANEQQRLELALIENLQRSDLTPLEAAEAYRQLIEEFTLSHEEIATQVGKSRTAVTNTLRLLKLPANVQQALVDGRISEGHARALLALPTPEAQEAALRVILKQELSVRQTEELVRKLSGHRPVRAPRPVPTPEVTALEERLRARLGTRVKLNRFQQGGSLVIHYYSDEELNALIEVLLGEQ
jgi:ParB family chromosome partitioning protein